MAKIYFGKNFKHNPLEIKWCENVEYIKLEEDKTFRVDGIGFSRGNFGVQPLVVRNTDSELTEIVHYLPICLMRFKSRLKMNIL